MTNHGHQGQHECLNLMVVAVVLHVGGVVDGDHQLHGVLHGHGSTSSRVSGRGQRLRNLKVKLDTRGMEVIHRKSI